MNGPDTPSLLQKIGAVTGSTALASGAALLLDGTWLEEDVRAVLEEAGADAARTEIRLGASALRSNGTSGLALHQEDYHLAKRPEVLVFLCIENDVGGGDTLVAPLDLGRLRHDDELSEAHVRFHRHSQAQWTPWRRVIEATGGLVWARLALPDVHRDVELDTGMLAFAKLAERLATTAEPVGWSAGRVLVIDNRLAVHGRRELTTGRRTLVRWVA